MLKRWQKYYKSKLLVIKMLNRSVSTSTLKLSCSYCIFMWILSLQVNNCSTFHAPSSDSYLAALCSFFVVFMHLSRQTIHNIIGIFGGSTEQKSVSQLLNNSVTGRVITAQGFFYHFHMHRLWQLPGATLQLSPRWTHFNYRGGFLPAGFHTVSLVNPKWQNGVTCRRRWATGFQGNTVKAK